MSVDVVPPAVSFYRWAEQYPDRTAVIEFDGVRTSSGELARRAHRMSHALRRAGVRAGSKVGLIASNSAWFFEVTLGCAQIGVPVVPINHHLTPTEVAFIVEDSGVELVFVDTAHTDLATALVELVDRTAVRFVLRRESGTFDTYDSFVVGASEQEPDNRVNANSILYTSGTTGRPKAVGWPASTDDPETALAGIHPLMALRGMDYDSDGLALVCGPLYHGAPNGWGIQALHHGHTVVLMDRWNSHGFLRLVETYGVTSAQMAPIHFRRLLSLPEEERRGFDTSSLNVITHAGAATPIEDKRRMMEWLGPILWEYYASSEGFGTSIGPRDWLAHPGSVGHTGSNGATMKVVDAAGDPLPAGEVGTLWIRNPGGLTSTYFGAMADTPMTDADGYYTAGDLAHIDSEGWLFIVDRRVDLILSGGVNIYPAEIEAVLSQHPSVADVAAVAAPDEEWGQRVHAVVVPTPFEDGSSDLEDRLLEYARTRLGRFKVPRTVEFRSELPYSPAGKLLRRVLRDELWTEQEVP